MSVQLPFWILVLQALATPALALLAVLIAIAQWRTAHQRAVLDLFQKKWQAYTEIRSIVSEVLREGNAPATVALRYARAIDEAKFLFGPEVYSYLQRVHRLVVDLHRAQMSMKENDKNYQKWVDNEADLLGEITQFYATAEPLLLPYMRMHQRVPWF